MSEKKNTPLITLKLRNSNSNDECGNVFYLTL